MNNTLRRLGYGPQDRVVIIHADDIGMCRAGNAALADLTERGLVSSAAVMVPCPWFPDAAAFCRTHPGVDMGVHLTVNAEFVPYRWGPISTRDPGTGMLDDQGYFHRSVAAARRHADLNAVSVELRAQVNRALAEGIDVTHLDAHMGTVGLPPFAQACLSLALEYGLPILLPPAAFLAQGAGSSPELVAQYERLARRGHDAGMPVFNAVTLLPLGPEPHDLEAVKRIIDSLRPGLTMLILHPAQNTPELRAITPDWPSRVSNYEACMSDDIYRHVRESGVQVIGYRLLRELLRSDARSNSHA